MKIRNEIKVGAVILVALALLYFGLNYLKGSDIFVRARYYYAFYDQIDGLTRDNFVMLNGARVGRVSSVELLPSRGNKILVKMQILIPDLQIPDSTKAVIINQDLLGSKGINLEFPVVVTSFHEDGDTLIAGLEKQISQIVEEKLAPIQSKIEQLVEETRDLVSHVRLTVTTINETAHTAEKAITTIDHATVTVDSLITRSNQRVRQILDHVEAITANLEANSENISEIMKNLATISDSLTRANFATAIENATRSLAQFDSLLTSINNGEGSIGMLVTDDKLYRNLEQASLELDKLAEDLRVNPGRYVHVSVFGNKEKPEEKPKKKKRDNKGQVVEPEKP